MEGTDIRVASADARTLGGARRLLNLPIPQSVAIFIAGLTLIRLALAAQLEPTTVECYYWLFGCHPQWSYFDHPGVVGWTIWLSRLLFGDGSLALRALPILMGSL